jgi:hypothetical protein
VPCRTSTNPIGALASSLTPLEAFSAVALDCSVSMLGVEEISEKVTRKIEERRGEESEVMIIIDIDTIKCDAI